MNENEAIEYLLSRYLAVGSRVNPPKEECERHNEIVDMAIKALEEVQKYRAIGTPEECQALKNRLTAKKVSLRHIRKFDGFDDGECPTCGKSVSRDFDGADIFCPDCGQKLDWSDEE